MKEANVLIVNLTGGTSEVARHLVLSGIGLTLMDDAPIRETDLQTNFLCKPDSIGKKKSEWCAEELR